MTARRARAGLVGVLAAVVLVAPAAPARAGTPAEEAVEAANAFLDRYVAGDGRVVRHDQGGDTVSEGQAYGLLVAVGIADRSRFDDIWAWTAAHLQRPDALLSWRWANGAVVDDQPATDADLAAASALALAGERFHDSRYLREARRIAAAILADETVTVGSMRVLVAGPWARPNRTVNVGYLIFNSMSRLWWATADPGWSAVASSARTLLDQLTTGAPHLPPDWSTVSADGRASASWGPDGRSPRFGYEAGRALVQLAVDCRAEGRAVAARAWPHFARLAADRIPAESTLGGDPIGTDRHALALVAAAASAQAAGDDGASDRLLDAATGLDRAHPTYYGAAWLAMARLWLDTSRLGGCRTG